MTEQAQATQGQQAQLSPAQKYLQSLLDRFNANPQDETLTPVQRALLSQVQAVTKEISSLVVQGEEVNNEIVERQNKLVQLNQQVLLKRGQSQGLVEALLALRQEEAVNVEQP